MTAQTPGWTPGPWTASLQTTKHGRDLGWIIEHGNGRIGWASLAYADTNREATADDPAREANARLIAAAPMLVEALLDARFALYGNGPGNPKIDAALAAAGVK